MPTKPSNLIYGVNEKPTLYETLILGLQHVCIVSVAFVLPVMIIQDIGGTDQQAEDMLRMSMIAAGIGVIVQALRRGPVGSGYLCPQVCGPSYFAVSMLAGETGGLPAIFGMTALAGGFEGIFSRIIPKLRALFPAEVTGTVVIMVGVTVIPPSVKRLLGLDLTHTALHAPSIAVAAVTLAIMIGITVWGKGKWRLYSILVGMGAGYLAAAAAGLLTHAEAKPLTDAPLVAIPRPGFYGWSFHPALLLPFLIACLCSTLKTVGDLTTCQKINDADWKRPEMKNIGRGILADGVGALSAGLMGGMGQSSSSSNIALSIATGVTSRRVAYATGGILFVLACFPKLAAVFVIMPSPVMGATLVFCISFMILAGIGIITSRMIDARKTFVIGISIILGLSVDMLPAGIYDAVPAWLHPVFTSSLSLATISAVLLNLIFRIGIAKHQKIILQPGVDTTETIRTFMDARGRAWGARKEVILRADAAISEFFEAVSAADLTKGPIETEVIFDEFRLDVNLRYDGQLLKIPQTPPTEARILDEDKGAALLAGYLIGKYVDRIKSDTKANHCHIHFHFKH